MQPHQACSHFETVHSSLRLRSFALELARESCVGRCARLRGTWLLVSSLSNQLRKLVVNAMHNSLRLLSAFLCMMQMLVHAP